MSTSSNVFFGKGRGGLRLVLKLIPVYTFLTFVYKVVFIIENPIVYDFT